MGELCQVSSFSLPSSPCCYGNKEPISSQQDPIKESIQNSLAWQSLPPHPFSNDYNKAGGTILVYIIKRWWSSAEVTLEEMLSHRSLLNKVIDEDHDSPCQHQTLLVRYTERNRSGSTFDSVRRNHSAISARRSSIEEGWRENDQNLIKTEKNYREMLSERGSF